jgi:pimeloyl-ACP methyl ester carboxylesterase
MQKTLLFSILACSVVFTACKKTNLNQLAFPSERLDEYSFEAYDAGDQGVPDMYELTPSDRTLIPLVSTDQETGDTYTIYAVYIGDIETIATDTIILYAHGQALHMDVYYPRASLLAHTNGKLNYGVLMMDYRGFGMSEGVSSESGLSEDVDACIDWLIANGATAERTIYYGFSLGCIPVIERAANRSDFKPAKMILESPLASVENLTHGSLLLNVNPKYITTLNFNNAEQIRAVTSPLMWLHGEIDDYVNIENGELVYSNHPGPKVAYRIKEGNHGDIPPVMGYNKYLDALGTFIRSE